MGRGNVDSKLVQDLLCLLYMIGAAGMKHNIMAYIVQPLSDTLQHGFRLLFVKLRFTHSAAPLLWYCDNTQLCTSNSIERGFKFNFKFRRCYFPAYNLRYTPNVESGYCWSQSLHMREEKCVEGQGWESLACGTACQQIVRSILNMWHVIGELI